MEYQVEWQCIGAIGAADPISFGDAGLDFSEQFRLQLHVSGLVDAVHVAEGEGSDVAALLAKSESFDRRNHVIEGRVEVVVDVVAHAIFFPAHDADLDFENRVDRLHPRKEGLRDFKVLRQRHG